MSEDYFGLWKFSENRLEFMEILWMIRYTGYGNIIVYKYWEIMFSSKIKYWEKGFIVYTWWFSLCEECEIIMSQEYLSDSTKYPRIKLEHIFDMLYRIDIHRIKPTHHRIKPIFFFFIKFIVFFCDNPVGERIIVTLIIIIEIIFRSIFLRLFPCLFDRHPENYPLLYIRLIHVVEEFLESFCFLEEVDNMDMCVRHLIFTSPETLKIAGLFYKLRLLSELPQFRTHVILYDCFSFIVHMGDGDVVKIPSFSFQRVS